MSQEFERVNDFEYRLPKRGAMRTDGLVFASPEMMKSLGGDPCLEQVRNVATLPGIVGSSFAMPDIHWGYGFPIGGVAGFDAERGIVSPGGVGYDINCGVRLLKTSVDREELAGRVQDLTTAFFAAIPAGVGSHRLSHEFSKRDYPEIFTEGAGWAVKRGYGTAADLNFIEEGGRLHGADPEGVGERAQERGLNQLGTLGSGNHFVELGYVDEVYEPDIADALGLSEGRVTVIVHTGSRGLGHQVCSDHLETMLKAARKYGIELPDPQLCCAPIVSDEGKKYLAAMAAAANFAFANRQMITHFVRQAFESVLAASWEALGVQVVYDVCHNIAKFEEHRIGGVSRRILVHRKGATRSYPAGQPGLPAAYREIGQPVLIPGDMGRYSYVLIGTEKALNLTFGSTCHGAGRKMSRNQAKKSVKGRNVERELLEMGVHVMGASRTTIHEEVPWAYKDVAEVVAAVEGAGLSRKVLRLKPLGVIKG